MTELPERVRLKLQIAYDAIYPNRFPSLDGIDFNGPENKDIARVAQVSSRA
jgi:hypothetical protein